MFAAEAAETCVRLAGLAQGIVAGVEVFALLQLVLQQVLLVWQLAIEAKQLLFLLGKRLFGLRQHGAFTCGWSQGQTIR